VGGREKKQHAEDGVLKPTGEKVGKFENSGEKVQQTGLGGQGGRGISRGKKTGQWGKAEFNLT